MHSNRMLHLNLKPKNIMLTQSGIVKLIDFGLAKQYNTNGEPEESTSLGLGTPISGKSSFRSSDSFFDKVQFFADPDYWKDYNIIEPTESLEHAIEKLRKKQQ